MRVNKWGAGHAIVDGAGMFIEVSLSDATLHLGLRGRGDILTAISKIAVEAAMAGIVVTGVQTSDIIVVEALRASDYLSWYRFSLESTSCSDLRLYMLKPTFSGSTPGVWPACRASA